jgi:hypothetical protein
MRPIIGRLLLGAAAFVGVSTLAVASVGAAARPVLPAGAGGHPVGVNQTQPAAGTYSGTVKQNGPTLVTHDNEGDRTLIVQPGATVMRDGKAVAINTLKKGDTLTATLAADGTVTRIDATSHSDSTGFLKWLIPLVIVALVLLALLAWFMSRRRRSDFIMEPDRPRTAVPPYGRERGSRPS